ncbi:MAG: Cof-type HAD-IIB family hydrolase [Actinobacteria bacterium]|nr:Cof-type HAD-IIB family hydrolase [Actinomycetota bacterium]
MTASSPDEIRLIATDLDGTLLRYDKSISPRNARAVRLAQEAGYHVIAATGRYPTSLPGLLAPLDIDLAVVSNGAQGFRLSTTELLFEETIPAGTAAAIMAALGERLPEARFEVVVDSGWTHYVQPGYVELVHDIEHRNFPLDYLELSTAEMLGHGIVKLAVRHPSATPDHMLATLESSGLTGFHATTSGAPFLEISGPGVTKAHGVAQLCALLGYEPHQVLAIGDARNDVEFLEWAGIGVAMGNAVPEAIAAADHTTASNEEDGLALVIETLVASPADFAGDLSG